MQLLDEVKWQAAGQGKLDQRVAIIKAQEKPNGGKGGRTGQGVNESSASDGVA